MYRRRLNYSRNSRAFTTYIELRRIGISSLTAYYLTDPTNLHAVEQKLDWWQQTGDLVARDALVILTRAYACSLA